ncbi:hypothetical protein VTJ04DRAFT_2856 [Mycothermus thermophilus]|uniref:uncharacterized protein n=1 Tax=Humicola insolens TaxID=85995 RepID=UPI00374483F2
MACVRSDFFLDPEKGLGDAPAHRFSDRLPFILLRGGANPRRLPIPEHYWAKNHPPLTLACLTGKLKVVEALIEAGAETGDDPIQVQNRRRKDPFGTPLQAACLWFGQRRDDPGLAVKLVKTLLAAGEKVDFYSPPLGSPLIAATYSLLPEVVEVLLDAGADPCLSMDVNLTPLYRIRVTAYEALQPPEEDFTESLRNDFELLQTGDFKCGPLRDEAENEERRERIRKLFLQYRPSPSRGVPSQAHYSNSSSSVEANPHDQEANLRWRARVTDWVVKRVKRNTKPKRHPQETVEDVELGTVSGGEAQETTPLSDGAASVPANTRRGLLPTAAPASNIVDG